LRSLPDRRLPDLDSMRYDAVVVSGEAAGSSAAPVLAGSAAAIAINADLVGDDVEREVGRLPRLGRQRRTTPAVSPWMKPRWSTRKRSNGGRIAIAIPAKVSPWSVA